MKRILSLVTLGATIAGLAPLSSARAAELESASLRLDWSVISYHMPFYLGLKRGFYRDAGLDLSIQEGKGSSGTVQLVGTGADTFGFADGAVVAKAVGTGIPVKMVMGILKNSPMALVYAGGSGMKSPSDLKGKAVSTCAGQATGVLLPAFLSAVALAPADVKVVNTQCGPPIYQAVAQHQSDAAASYGPPGKTYLEALGVTDIKRFEFSKAGITIPAHGILTSVKIIQSKPETVRRFVSATVKSWLAAREAPDEAVSATIEANPLLKGKEAALRSEFLDYLNYVDTPNTEGKPFGWQSDADWKAAEATLAKYMDLQPQPSIAAYFTNDFIPK